VLVGEKLHFYYVGLAAGHKTGTRGKGLAFLRKDGYVSRRADGDALGLLTTIPVSLPLRPETRLVLNATTFDAGSIRVSVLDAKGQPLAGYATDNCQLVQGDKTTLPVRWNGHDCLPDLGGEPICLRFELRKAEIYGYELAREGTP
jgi:hypothetical protein